MNLILQRLRELEQLIIVGKDEQAALKIAELIEDIEDGIKQANEVDHDGY